MKSINQFIYKGSSPLPYIAANVLAYLSGAVFVNIRHMFGVLSQDSLRMTLLV